MTNKHQEAADCWHSPSSSSPHRAQCEHSWGSMDYSEAWPGPNFITPNSNAIGRPNAAVLIEAEISETQIICMAKT